MLRSFCVVAACATLCPSLPPDSCRGAESIPLHGESTLHFAAVEEGRATLRRADRFTKVLSRFDREARMQRLDVTLEQFLDFIAGEVVAWEEPERAKVREAAAFATQRLAALKIPFPERILLVHTSGREEGGAAYCRGAAIVLPQPLVKRAKPERLRQLLLHELFHILSANNEPLRRELYALVGFRSCPPVQLPAALRDRKLTNPDGPGLDYCIRLERSGGEVSVVPLLTANVDRYDAERGGSFFQYLQFHLLIVEAGSSGQLQAALLDGRPQLLDPKTEPSFHRQIGANTGYIYHPDEILADNFVFLAIDRQELKSPEIVAGMRKLLSR